jgi:integrase
MNRPRGSKDAALRIPPSDAEVATLFAGWREKLGSCRKFAPTARNYAAARLMAEVGLRVNEACSLDLDDIKWGLGRFGKLHVRPGKGARGSGPRERMVPLINDAGRTLRWFIEDVGGHFDSDHIRSGAPLFPSERKNADGTCRRVGDDALRAGLAEATCDCPLKIQLSCFRQQCYRTRRECLDRIDTLLGCSGRLLFRRCNGVHPAAPTP